MDYSHTTPLFFFTPLTLNPLTKNDVVYLAQPLHLHESSAAQSIFTSPNRPLRDALLSSAYSESGGRAPYSSCSLSVNNKDL